MKVLLRHRTVVIGIGAAVLLVSVVMTFRYRATSGRSDLSFRFLGLTNNPVPQSKPYQLSVFGSSDDGTYALFRLKSLGRIRPIGFETLGVEQLTAEGWKPFSPTGPWRGMSGSVWFPGGGSTLVAIGWPPGLSSNATWRLALRWRRELPIPRKVIDQLSHWNLFHYDEMRFEGSSSPVLTSAPNKSLETNRRRASQF